jgi:hypothetical protein
MLDRRDFLKTTVVALMAAAEAAAAEAAAAEVQVSAQSPRPNETLAELMRFFA